MPSNKMLVARRCDGSLLAWITQSAQERFVAAFVGAGAVHQRAPATQLCSTRDEAEQWVKDEAAALDVSIEWVDPVPRG
jgi:hypothetical protein